MASRQYIQAMLWLIIRSLRVGVFVLALIAYILIVLTALFNPEALDSVGSFYNY